MNIDPELDRLARLHGVATSYRDWADTLVTVGRPAVVKALAALDVSAGNAGEVTASLAAVDQALWARLLPPTVVVRVTEGETASVTVHAASADEVTLTVQLEDGSVCTLPVDGPVIERRGDLVRRRQPLPVLPLGWHQLTAVCGDRSERAVLVVAPESLPALTDRAWGWMLQLYSLRSENSWAMGDYADLRTVVDAAVADGAGVVLLNPLHAETPVVPINPSPYSPSSRRFRSAIYLHLEDTPEYTAADAEVRAAVDALRPAAEPDRIPRDPVWRAKLDALELLWPLHRVQELADWRAERGPSLTGFATFCALAETHGAAWQLWPEPLRRPDSPAVAEAATRAGRPDRLLVLGAAVGGRAARRPG